MSKADLVSRFKDNPLDFDSTEQAKLQGPIQKMLNVQVKAIQQRPLRVYHHRANTEASIKVADNTQSKGARIKKFIL